VYIKFSKLDIYWTRIT